MEARVHNAGSDDIYEVERILRKRNHPTKGVLYFVKWLNFPNSANTWEPACNFSQKLIDAYESSLKRKKHNSKPRETPKPETSANIASVSYPLPSSSSSSLASSCSSSTTIISTSTSQVDPKKGRSKKHSDPFRQRLAQLKLHFEQQEQMAGKMGRNQLAIFNPVTDNSKPVVGEVACDRELTKEPIIVTDVTAKDLTVTISECKIPEGFFKT